MMKRLMVATVLFCLAGAVHAEGDAKAGKRVFSKCKSCHTLKEDKHKTGPSLYKIMDAPAGAAEFQYSDALTSSGLIWDAGALSAFLLDPKGYLPGNKMSFAGLKKQEDIDNLIAYIQNKSD